MKPIPIPPFRAARAPVLAALLGLLAAVPAGAVPALMNYQGQLSNSGGPVNGSVAMTFRLYGAPTGGSALWTESYPSISVTGGVFSVLLGSSAFLPLGSLLTGETLWIETVVDGKVMSPRRPIVSVAYAGRAALADSAVKAPAVVPAGSVVYTRWGRTSCPAGSSTVYQGYAATSHYTHSGGGHNLICLTTAPTWDGYSDTPQANSALLWGVEYETGSSGLAAVPPFSALQDYEVPCTVCLRESVRVSLMIPGTQVCPSGWNLEYSGYLMSSAYTQAASEFVCVDRDAEPIGSNINQNGGLLYPTETRCTVLPCLPYVSGRELTCAVCTRP